MRYSIKTLKALTVSTSIILALASTSAHAEFVISLFGGMALTEDGDIGLRQNGGTDLTIHDATYEGKDFEPSQYYGGRGMYFLHRDRSGFGFGIEYIHSKVYLVTDRMAYVTGTRDGVPVNGTELISDSIEHFNNSHGMNFFFADATYRWVFSGRDKSFLGRIQPYIGVGLGAAIPHVESTVDGKSYNEMQFHGPAVQALGGLNFDITRHWSIYSEYKFTYIDLEECIPGGSIHFDPHTHHLVMGISFSF